MKKLVLLLLLPLVFLFAPNAALSQAAPSAGAGGRYSLHRHNNQDFTVAPGGQFIQVANTGPSAVILYIQDYPRAARIVQVGPNTTFTSRVRVAKGNRVRITLKGWQQPTARASGTYAWIP